MTTSTDSKLDAILEAIKKLVAPVIENDGNF